MQPIDFLYRSAQCRADALAVDAPSARLSYAMLVEQVNALAAAFQDFDPRPQSRVAICAHNNLEHLLGLLATMAADKVWVPLNPRDAPAELNARIDATCPSLIVVDEDCLDCFTAPNARLIIAHRKTVQRAVARDTLAGMLAHFDGARPARPGQDLKATQAIKFTGGSSGRPKGVVQPYRAWVTGALSMLHAFRFDAGQRYLIAAPLTHGTSCYVTPIFAAGGTLVLLDGKATPELILQALRQRDVTTTFLPPTLIYMLMERMSDMPRRCPRLRQLIYGGAAMTPDKLCEARERFGAVLATNYGQTEAPQIITALAPEEFEDPRNIASVGRPGITTRIEIMDGQGRIREPGEDGEIVVRGDLLMSGYLDMPEETAKVLVDGWLHTGDVGYLDERGYLFIKDRIRDVIISGGFNIYPSDVEAALSQYPGIYECTAFALPDDKWGEAVQIAVQLHPGAAASADEILAFAKERLGSVKAPKQVYFVESLPRSSIGKVQRREVQAIVKRKLGSDKP